MYTYTYIYINIIITITTKHILFLFIQFLTIVPLVELLFMIVRDRDNHY